MYSYYLWVLMEQLFFSSVKYSEPQTTTCLIWHWSTWEELELANWVASLAPLHPVSLQWASAAQVQGDHRHIRGCRSYLGLQDFSCPIRANKWCSSSTDIASKFPESLALGNHSMAPSWVISVLWVQGQFTNQGLILPSNIADTYPLFLEKRS